MTTLNRRAFLQSGLAASAAWTVSTRSRVLGANDRVVIGVMGLGGRGTFLAQTFAGRADATVAWVADPDQRRLPRAVQAVETAQGTAPRRSGDFRQILDDAAVDVLVNATPDHWHALGTVLACEAGKDVYVEKPLSHNLWEGRQMIRAGERYGRVIQVGIQSRSARYVQAARDYLASGALGEVKLVRVFNLMRHDPAPLGAATTPPDQLDYEMWTGPAELLPYVPNRQWLSYANYSCGAIAGDAIHQLDLARYLMGDPLGPRTLAHSGGIHVLQDGRDTPDTQFALFDFDTFTLLFEGALWTPYMKKTPVAIRDTDAFPNWPFSSTKVELVGTNGFMLFGRHGGGWQAYDADGDLARSEYGRQADREHQDDFLDCVRSRRKPRGTVEQGHASTSLCHLANIAWRMGNRRLTFDPVQERFPEMPAADDLLRRRYRAPWTLPTI